MSFTAAELLACSVCQAGTSGQTVTSLSKMDTDLVRIEFESTNPEIPRDYLDGLNNDPTVIVFSDLEFSNPEMITGRIRAMLIVHASDGPNEWVYAARFRELGIATIRINSFVPQRVTNTVGKRRAVSEWSIVADAYRELALLAIHPAIDPARIGIIGWSKGVQIAYVTAFEPIRRAVRVENLKFAVHFRFYRTCLQVVRIPMTGAPVREHIGELDNYTGTQRCISEAKYKRAARDDVEIRLYPGAHYGFDGGRSGLVRCARCWNVTKCHLILRADGRQQLGIGDSFDACVKFGTTVGGNEVACAAAISALLGTLPAVFDLQR